MAGKYKGIFFDADDTLFDYPRAERAALLACLRRIRASASDAATFIAAYRRHNHDVWQAFERGETDQATLRVERFRRLAAELGLAGPALGAGQRLLPGGPGRPAAAAARGAGRRSASWPRNIPLALITNGIAAVQNQRFAASPITAYFQSIVISEEVGIAKPDPRIFAPALEKIGVAAARRPLRRRQRHLGHGRRPQRRHGLLLAQPARAPRARRPRPGLYHCRDHGIPGSLTACNLTFFSRERIIEPTLITNFVSLSKGLKGEGNIMKNIVIIGAGLGGLVAGNLLARKGHKVTIFESHVLPGGYTAGFWRKGFYFESGTLSFESSSTVFKALKDIGVYDALTFERHAYRFKSNDFDGTPDTYDDYKKMLAEAYPSQKEALDRYFREVDRLYRPMGALLGDASLIRKLLAGASFGLQYLKFRGRTISEFTARYFPKGSQLYRTLSSLGYPDMSALFIGGALFSIFEDYWTVKEGFQALADALADRFAKEGGALRLHSPVERIVTHGGAAVGVRCQGEDIPADVVIAACDYKQTFLTLLAAGDVPGELREKIQKTAVSEGIAALYFGLSISNEELLNILKRPFVAMRRIRPGSQCTGRERQGLLRESSIFRQCVVGKKPETRPGREIVDHDRNRHAVPLDGQLARWRSRPLP